MQGTTRFDLLLIMLIKVFQQYLISSCYSLVSYSKVGFLGYIYVKIAIFKGRRLRKHVQSKRLVNMGLALFKYNKYKY